MPTSTHARILDGKRIAEDLLDNLKARVDARIASGKPRPGLAVVLVGSDPASSVYVRNKRRAAEKVGIRAIDFDLPADTGDAELLSLIDRLNADPGVHGILVQLPLPSQVDTDKVIGALDPAKDVDGFHVINAGRLATGQESLVPCTPVGCVMLARDRLGSLSGLEAVVVGRSNIVGKPVAQLLLAENCTVTIAHSRTRDLAAVCRRADILVAAVGRPEMIRGDWIKPGACVIDVGFNRVDKPGGGTRLVGDVCFDEAVKVAGAITPVPGGVGPMTIACLLLNTVRAACAQAGVPVPEI
jgi:methylenetetrahydrofolate dehydrogenase (NADP+)/methenyltetrahydrofolate cyclohydrolase